MRRTRLLLAAAVLAALAVTAGRAAGRFLVVANPLPARADAIVMLAGSLSDRVLETARLYHAGVAPLVLLTRERLRPGAPALRAHGVFLPEEHELAKRALGELGVPAAAIRVVARRATSTTTEARAIARWVCGHGLRDVVVVTSPSHTRRARLILAQALGPGVSLTVRPAPAALFPAEHWWQRRRAMKEVLMEYEKLLAYWLVERWTIEPCGGLRRPTAQRASTDWRIKGASSPLACSSRTMSQPPTNFPPTKSCGIVGQFVYALTPSRFSASARMSIALNGTPISFSTSTVAAEKPHIGKRGVPFM